MNNAVELCVRSGVSLPLFSPILADITPGFTAFFQHQIDTIDKGDFTVTQSPLAISIAATQRIKTAFEKQGLSNDFWKNITRLFQDAEDHGLGGQELASIIKVIRQQAKEKALSVVEAT